MTTEWILIPGRVSKTFKSSLLATIYRLTEPDRNDWILVTVLDHNIFCLKGYRQDDHPVRGIRQQVCQSILFSMPGPNPFYCFKKAIVLRVGIFRPRWSSPQTGELFHCVSLSSRDQDFASIISWLWSGFRWMKSRHVQKYASCIQVSLQALCW